MGHDLAHIGIPLTEKVIRTVVVYAVIAVLLRLAGKRDLGQFNTFDLVVMLLLSNVVQNAIIGNDNSLVGGIVGAVVLIAVNAVVVRVGAINPTIGRVFEGHEATLVDDGRYDHRVLQREGLRQADVEATLRRQGAHDVSEVQRATLGVGGAVIVELRPEMQPATKADVAAIVAAVNRLEQRLPPTR